MFLLSTYGVGTFISTAVVANADLAEWLCKMLRICA